MMQSYTDGTIIYTYSTGNKTGDIGYIELKQLYNKCTQKGLDPNKTITVSDYSRLMREEDI